MPGKRRGGGEGAIYQRASDKRWVTSVELGHVAGRRRRRVLYGRTRKEVAEKLRALHAQQEAGALRGVDKTTLGAYLLDWLDGAGLTRDASTVAGQRSVIEKHIIPTIGGLRRDQVTPQDINALMKGLVDQGMAATAKLARQVLRVAYVDAVTAGLCRTNPAALTKVPKYEARMPRSLSLEEAQRLLDVLEGERFGIAVKLGLLLGLRRGEISGLRWSDIDWNAQTITIARTAKRTGKKRITKSPKTKASARVLPLVGGLDVDLRAHQAAQAEEFALKGIENKDDLIVASQAATQYDTGNYLIAFRALLTKAELPAKDIRPHDLRHSTAILLISNGVDPRTAAQILGHANAQITLDIYTRSQQGNKAQAIEELGERLRKKK